MNLLLDLRSPHDLSALSRRERVILRETALALGQAASAGQPRKPLRGKNIALLSEADTEGARALAQAASEAGAQVARIRPSDAGLADPQTVPETARLLGRLYDAVACEGLPPALVHALQQETGVPVYQDLGSFELLPGLSTEDETPAAAGEGETAVARRDAAATAKHAYLLQAVLLSTIA